MVTRLARRPATLAGTFSFYVPSSDSESLAVVSSFADAVTVKGPKGPAVVRALRAGGWDCPVIFDRGGYDPKTPSVDTERWLDEQAAAGADRPLTAGTWVTWDASGETLKWAIDIEAARCDRHPETTAVLAVDHRWLTRSPMELAGASTPSGVRRRWYWLIRQDPLSAGNAVQGLLAVTRSVEDLALMRTDHGGLGALVYGARHAAIGLVPPYRHFIPPDKAGGGKRGDRSARVFVRDLMDWYTGVTIAGWTTARIRMRCLRGARSGSGV